MSILLTGGAGYIGSHTAVELLNQNYDVIIADNLSNSEASVLDGIEQITGETVAFYEIDVCDREALRWVFDENDIEAVIHFAGFKAVGESVEKPLEYYQNNLNATITLLMVMREYNVNNIIFSSSATVYSLSEDVPFTEETEPLGCTNPYGWTKYMGEQILKDACVSNKDLSVVILRYFNPIGAHESGLIGEKPNGIPNNLMPYVTQVAQGIRERLNVFGDDYPTKDGTGVRDYIHVVDLAIGHVKALAAIEKNCGVAVYNLGTGQGYSVLDIVKAFEKASGVKIPYVIDPRRPGDIAECWADPSLALRELGWKAVRSLDDTLKAAWEWEKYIADKA